MQVIFIGNIINIFLNYILINGKWGVPAMGVLGAGIGTLLSRTLMVLLFVGFFYKKNDSKVIYLIL